jgi:D-tyrosyl-tRNA(Tyr) deacylase
MRAVIQRVTKASVKIKGKVTKINKGFVVFIAVNQNDRQPDVDYLTKKIANLRILPDKKGLMNKSIVKEGGDILVISQFTLYARTRKGNRPSFADAANPEKAIKFYELFIKRLKGLGLSVSSGEFGEYMQISLTNDGPVTIILDSQERKQSRKNK